MKPLIKNPGAIRLGIVRMTEGNGHPYSRRTIFDGYDRKLMTEECLFPGTPGYLNKEEPRHFANNRRKCHAYILQSA